jgi:quercetin dioxygenase-like cupin family protein
MRVVEAHNAHKLFDGGKAQVVNREVISKEPNEPHGFEVDDDGHLSFISLSDEIVGSEGQLVDYALVP